MEALPMEASPSSAAAAAAAAAGGCLWARLGTDLTELILSLLPLRSVVRAGAVCKFWRAVVTHPAFASRFAPCAPARAPWFFLYGQNNVHLRRNQAFAFDPAAGEWIHLPPLFLSSAAAHGGQSDECFVGSGGFIFATSASARTSFCYAPLLHGATNPWRETPPLNFSRLNPVVGVVGGRGQAGAKFIVAGGVRFVGGLVDIEDQLAVEIYDPAAGGWQLCAPLPPEFGSGYSSQWLTSALVGGESFYVLGIYSGLLARFDLARRVWSGVRALRPPGVSFSFLVACNQGLVLAGLWGAAPPALVVWRVEAEKDGWKELGKMPSEMLATMFEGEGEEERFASLRCVGVGGLLYAFNEAHHRGYPACVCELRDDGCSWRKLPPLPGPVNRFHRVITFCSAVPLESVLGGSC